MSRKLWTAARRALTVVAFSAFIILTFIVFFVNFALIQVFFPFIMLILLMVLFALTDKFFAQKSRKWRMIAKFCLALLIIALALTLTVLTALPVLKEMS